MKISKLEPVLAGGRYLFLKLHTDEGLIGYGECGAWGYQEATVQAALTCDRTLAFDVFMNDPLMGAVGLAEGRQLFDDMIRNTLNYLPEAWRG